MNPEGQIGKPGCGISKRTFKQLLIIQFIAVPELLTRTARHCVDTLYCWNPVLEVSERGEKYRMSREHFSVVLSYCISDSLAATLSSGRDMGAAVGFPASQGQGVWVGLSVL